MRNSRELWGMVVISAKKCKMVKNNVKCRGIVVNKGPTNGYGSWQLFILPTENGRSYFFFSMSNSLQYFQITGIFNISTTFKHHFPMNNCLHGRVATLL